MSAHRRARARRRARRIPQFGRCGRRRRAARTSACVEHQRRCSGGLVHVSGEPALCRRRRHRWAPDEARRRPTSLPNITPWHDGHAHHREVSVGSSPRSPGNTTRQRPHWRGDGGPENPGMVPPGSCSGGGVGPACPETTPRVIRFKRGVPTKWTMRHLDRTPVRTCRPRTSRRVGVWARLFRLLGSDVFQPGTRPLGPLEHQVSTDR